MNDSTRCVFFFSSRRRHTRYWRDWSSDVCSSDLNGQRTGRKKPRGRLDAALADRFHQAKAMVVGVFHLTYQIEIASGSGHSAAILPVARRPALPPAGRPSPLRTNTLQLHQGVTMYPSNSTG